MALGLVFLGMVENDLLTKESQSQWASEMLEDSRFLFADSSHADPKVRSQCFSQEKLKFLIRLSHIR